MQVRACSRAVCKAVPLAAPVFMLMIQNALFCAHQLKERPRRADQIGGYSCLHGDLRDGQ